MMGIERSMINGYKEELKRYYDELFWEIDKTICNENRTANSDICNSVKEIYEAFVKSGKEGIVQMLRVQTPVFPVIPPGRMPSLVSVFWEIFNIKKRNEEIIKNKEKISLYYRKVLEDEIKIKELLIREDNKESDRWKYLECINQLLMICHDTCENAINTLEKNRR